MAVSFNGLLLFTFSLIILLSLPIRSQDTTPTTEVAAAPSPSPSADTCNGIFLTYQYEKGEKLSPRLSKGSPKQPYKFESSFSIENTDEVELKQWMVSVGFQHDEFLVSATDVVLFDGTSIPASVGNGTVFAGFPVTDLKTAIETAGDETQTKVTAKLVGTQFGVAPPAVPLPANISLANDGYRCPEPFKEGNTTLLVCCVRDPTFKANVTLDEGFLPRQSGDLTIMYDVTKTYPQNYWAQVTISNHNSLGRLDYWQLSFDWMRDEFIFSMRGAYPSIVETNECVFGKQAQQYADLDFSTVLNCQRRPIIVDLPLSYENDTKLGFVQHCCRNGSILPPSMDPSKSISAFQMQVYKMPPDLNRSTLIPPQNWQINGTLNPNYVCGPPIRVSPSEFPDPSGVPTNFTAVASWQVVCNITRSKNASPKCCVSFSAYFNESIIPCKTCACGCPSKTARTCSTTAPALFIPAEAQLVPFDNRTKLALAWAHLKHRLVPNPLPCGDNCGVSLNWHLYTDFNKGWTARVTLFNWEEVSFADWFVAVEMNKAAPGFEKAYSFNGTLMSGNETIFMQGLPGLNYLMGETNGTDPTRDPRVPGKQQSVLSFTKKLTRGINVAEGGGFPTKVYFNGEECSLPDILPINGIHKRDPIVLISFLIAAVVFIFIQQLL